MPHPLTLQVPALELVARAAVVYLALLLGLRFLRCHIGLGRELLAEQPELFRRKSLAQERLVEPGGFAVVERAPLAPQRLLEKDVGPLLEQAEEFIDRKLG